MITQLLKDLCMLKKPYAFHFSKRNKVYPFEDATSLEFFSQKNDCSLFAFGSHLKKRPHNLIIGRFFEYHLLDMIELGITNYQPLIKGSKQAAFGSKPCFVFIGEEFQQNGPYKKLASILLDFFRGEQMSMINLVGLDHVIICTVIEGIVDFRRYAVILKKSGTKLPHVELEDIGPSFEMIIRRTQFASEDLMKEALKTKLKMNKNKKKKSKNISTNPLLEKRGRIHMPKQDLTKLATRKMKGLKRKKGRR